MKRALVPWAGFLLASTAALAQPQITLEANSVVASGITPGGHATLLGVVKTQPEWRVKVERVDARLADEDGDGVVIFPTTADIPVTSVWAVVDETTGETALQRPPGVNLRALTLTTGALAAIEGGTVTGLSFDCRVLDVLVVRPGSGSWAQTVFDGGQGDSDAEAQGLIVLDLSSLTPIDGGPELKGEPLQVGDRLVLVDPTQMSVAAVTVGASSR